MVKQKLSCTYDFSVRARKNLGTFNTHLMDEYARNVFFDYAGVNAVDSYAYPEIEQVKKKCAEFILSLLNAKGDEDFQYFTTSGSSESVLLAILVLKTQHQHLNHYRVFKPNIVIGKNSHVAWFKAAKYLQVDVRIAGSDTLLVMDNLEIMTLIDENTVGICCTIGAPTTLLADDVMGLDTKLAHHHRITGQFIPIHVDAASGGFVIPFVNPELMCDFRLKHVFSMNVSSHKYGLVYPSLGWLFMRNTPCLEELLDEIGYLGKSIKCFSMQFSHSASHLMAQYYYIRTLGYAGYKQIILQLFGYAKRLKQALADTQENIRFVRSDSASLPGLIFFINNIDMCSLSRNLKEKGWCLPVYSLPGTKSELQVARVVVRKGHDDLLLNELVSDIKIFSQHHVKSKAEVLGI
ncbi:MAG: pyridoxal-dependent decarboxylase [Legionellaceae bacterium]|nr:pyridoxal-dependent decarboxylase [Legionellaceae bacterium]